MKYRYYLELLAYIKGESGNYSLIFPYIFNNLLEERNFYLFR